MPFARERFPDGFHAIDSLEIRGVREILMNLVINGEIRPPCSHEAAAFGAKTLSKPAKSESIEHK